MDMFKEGIWESEVVSVKDTVKLVQTRLCTIKIPYCIYLEGDVGLGKTFICKTIASYFDIENLSSSSFSYLNIYYSHVKLIHADYYCNKTSDEFFYNNIYDEINNKTILLNEWSPCYHFIDIPQYILNLETTENEKRKFIFSRLR